MKVTKIYYVVIF